MTDRELEQKLAAAVERRAPDDLDAILSRCGAQNGSVMELKLNHKKSIRWLAAACAALALLGAGGGGLVYHQSCAVASVVSLDVNPSIELKVNRGGRVISCAALNEEAAAVLFSMDGGADLKGTKLDVAVNAVVGALVQAGYLDSISSAILISVEDSDQTRAERLQAELTASVDSVLQTQAPGTNVLGQVVVHDAVRMEYGSADGISSGKAALVQKVIDGNGMDASAFDQLAALSVEELSDLLKTGETRIPIGKPAACMAVQAYAGTEAVNSVTADVDPELDESVYEVELHTGWGKFEYIVDAFTGQVLSGQRDILTQTPSDPVTPAPLPEPPGTGAQTPGTGQDIGQDAAKLAALNNAGLAEGDVTSLKIEREWDDGRLEYEIEFWCGTSEYECTVDGHTGSVLKCGVDHHGSSGSGHHSDPHHGGNTGSVADIGQEAAKAAALAHAGVTESQAVKLKVKQDWDDGRLEYEVEFEVGRMEYEYTIDGATGAILEYEWDD